MFFVVSSSLLLSSSKGSEQAEVLSLPFLLLAQNVIPNFYKFAKGVMRIR
jgi:hypothetical protein